MIASIKGRVLSKKPDALVVDVGGIGYHVSVPLSNLSSIPDVGKEIFLHTYTYVREDALELYGFIREEEKRVFVTLLGVNGIGPRLGLAILSGMSSEKLIEAVYNEDVALLTTIPGLGKKMAGRLILELRGKLPRLTISPRDSTIANDAISALLNLGYKKSLSEEAVERALSEIHSKKDGRDTIEDIIKAALKYLTERK